MPSYADEIAARQAAAAAGSSGARSGPVRLTISRGDAFVGPNGETMYREEWEEEEIMETELVSSVDDELSKAAVASRNGDGAYRQHGESLATSLQNLGGALLVLDTNTLLSALPLLRPLFAQCLARNAFALENKRFDRSPISLIVPHVVLSELDALKSMRSNAPDSKTANLASNAQAVNRWILDSLRQQKKQVYTIETPSGHTTGEVIPESAWALHVESSAHANARRDNGDTGAISPDEEIVEFCASLQQETGLTVSFCSDDVNARLRAESDALATFSLSELMKSLEGGHQGTRQEALERGAADLIEQWGAQLGYDTPDVHSDFQFISSSADANVLPATMDVDMDRGMSAQFDEAAARRISVSGVSGRSIKDSVYARRTDTSPRQRKRSPVLARSTTATQARIPGDKGKRDEGQISYEYPADRSSASSRWARC